MLRPVTNIIMTCLLLISTTGFAVSKHYCGENLISVELKTEADACCDDGTCCHTERQLLQVDNDFLSVSSQTSIDHLFASDFILTTFDIEHPLKEAVFKTTLNYSEPHPGNMGTRLAIQQVYRL